MEFNENNVVIKKVSNGFVLTTFEIETDGKMISEDELFKSEGSDTDDKLAFSNLLYAIGNLFGYSYDKYSDDNLNISFDKRGHKLE